MPSFISDPNSKKIEKIAQNYKPFEGFCLLLDPYKWKFGQLPYHTGLSNLQYQKPEFKLPVPGEGLPRIIHYCADQSGCAFWRMIYPANELLAHNKAVVMTLYQMVQFAPFYGGIDAIRVQRQCSEPQRDFIKWLREISNEYKKQTGKSFRIIYDVDDVIFTDGIPEYNACRSAFLDPQIEKNVKEIMSYTDELVVPSQFMAKLYSERLNFKKVSVIPNYLPGDLIDKNFNLEEIMHNYDKNKHRPRIVYAGSSTHFDVKNEAGQKDDFSEVIDHIISDINGPNKYQWVFLGGFPLKLMPYVQSGKVEYHQWGAISDYIQLLKNLKGNIMIAPLLDNTFNRAKANIKLTEGGTVGLPVIAQNLDCYNKMDEYPYLFDTTKEMFNHIDNLMGNRHEYENAVKFCRELSEKYYLKNHLDEWMLLYTTEYGSKERMNSENFLKNNPNQFK